MKKITALCATAAVLLLTACGGGKTTDTADTATDTTTAAAETPAQADAATAVTEWTNNAAITPDATLPVIIDFNADWCGPCRAFAPIFHQAAKEYEGRALFYSVNVDNCPAAAAPFDVQAIPTIVALQPDGSTTVATGAMSATEFAAWVDAALARK